MPLQEPILTDKKGAENLLCKLANAQMLIDAGRPEKAAEALGRIRGSVHIIEFTCDREPNCPNFAPLPAGSAVLYPQKAAKK